MSLKHKTKFIKQSKSAQEIQDDIFRRMSAEEKSKLVLDFMPIGLELKLSEGTPVPMAYLRQWFKLNGLSKKYKKYFKI